MKSDLHLHSTVSDGLLTPTELVDKVFEAGIRIMSLTDHDSTDGLSEAITTAAKYDDLILIPGVELSTDTKNGEIHILGYFIDMESQDLQKTLESFREDRLYRAKSMVEKLTNLGYKITWDEVLKVAGSGSVGRPHIAEILAETGQVSSIKAAFDELIGRNGPAYTERRKMDPETAIELIVQHSGIPVLAHPREVNNLDEILPSLVSSGLKGMETYYGRYSTQERTRFQQLCDNHNLLATGGSDYHGPDRAAECDLGDSKTNLQVGKLLLKMHDELEI